MYIYTKVVKSISVLQVTFELCGADDQVRLFMSSPGFTNIVYPFTVYQLYFPHIEKSRNIGYTL